MNYGDDEGLDLISLKKWPEPFALFIPTVH